MPKAFKSYQKELFLRCVKGFIYVSKTAYSSLSMTNRGRPCCLNSLFGTPLHFLKNTCNGNINQYNNNDNNCKNDHNNNDNNINKNNNNNYNNNNNNNKDNDNNNNSNNVII